MVLKVNELAPPFELPELILSKAAPGSSSAQPERLCGETWSLSQHLAKGPVFLVFVKESCPTCQFILPFVNRIYLNYPRWKVSIAIIAQEHPRLARKMVQEFDVLVPVLLDQDPYPVSDLYRLSFVPSFLYISSKGEIERVIESFSRENLKDINQRIAQQSGLKAQSFLGPQEGIPFFRPG